VFDEDEVYHFFNVIPSNSWMSWCSWTVTVE
jgi:hypothetical protein